jgi:hypothetical protein
MSLIFKDVSEGKWQQSTRAFARTLVYDRGMPDAADTQTTVAHLLE